MAKARAAALRALELDPELAEAHSALGLVLAYEWNWTASRVAFEKALALNPGSVWALRAFAVTLAQQHRLEEALALVERSRELDPLNAMPWDPDLGNLYSRKGDDARATHYWETALEIDSRNVTPLQAYGTYRCRRGEYAEAIALLERAREVASEVPTTVADLGYCLAIAGRTAEARAVLAELEAWSDREYVDPTALALVRIGLGEDRNTLDALERALEVHAHGLPTIAIDPRYAPLRDEPRFRAVLRRMDLEGLAPI